MYIKIFQGRIIIESQITKTRKQEGKNDVSQDPHSA